MEFTDSYIEGFCKMAEQHGVDPEQLLKQALSWGDIASKGISGLSRIGSAFAHPVQAATSAAGAARRGTGRLLELLSGGNKTVMRPLGENTGGLSAFQDGKLRAANNEFRKVVGTRAAAGTALLGGGAYAMSGQTGNPQAVPHPLAAMPAGV